jgi:hypothetical protein
MENNGEQWRAMESNGMDERRKIQIFMEDRFTSYDSEELKNTFVDQNRRIVKLYD